MRNISTVLIGIASVATFAVAGQAFDAEAAAKTLAPFLDEQTIFIARIDVTRLDIDAIFAEAAEIVQRVETDQETKQAVRKGLSKPKQIAQGWIAEFTGAGGREVYVVVSYLPGVPGFVVVPLHGKADGNAIVEFLRGGAGASTRPSSGAGKPEAARAHPLPLRPEVCVQVGKAVFAGSRQALERVKQGRPAARPEVAKAFAAAGDAAFQALLLPTADSRKVIEEMMPVLPEEIGGGPSTAITRGFLWAAIGVNPPPKASLRLTIQSQDAASAKALRGLIERIFEKALETAAKDRLYQTVLSVIKLHIPMLTPAVKGDRLTLSLDEKQLDKLIFEVIAPPLRQARGMARRAMSMANVRQITTAIHMYANAHKGQIPPDLRALVKDKLIDPRVLINPSRPKRKVGYIYIRAPLALKQLPPTMLLIHEAYDEWKEGIVVGFVDTHVKLIRDEAQFKKLLARTKEIRTPKD